MLSRLVSGAPRIPEVNERQLSAASGRTSSAKPDGNPGTPKLPSQSPVMNVELLGNHGERESLLAAGGSLGDRRVVHLADDSSPRHTVSLEMFDHGRPVDAVVAGQGIDRRACDVRPNQLVDLRRGEPSCDGV
jgi:hypothetical protein